MNPVIAELINLGNGLALHDDKLGRKICVDSINEVERLEAEVKRLEAEVKRLRHFHSVVETQRDRLGQIEIDYADGLPERRLAEVLLDALAAAKAAGGNDNV